MKRVKVTIYSRPECHLCDEAMAAIKAADCAALYELEMVDVDSDQSLKERYGYDIPVVTLNGIMCFKHRLDSKEFKRKVTRFLKKK